MKESLYFGQNVAIINFNIERFNSCEDLASSDGYRLFLERYLKDLAIRDINAFKWITNGKNLEELIPEIVRLSKQLLVLDADEIYDSQLVSLDRIKAYYLAEDGYNYWRSRQRFSILNATNNSVNFMTLMEVDTKYNQLVLQLYRSCQEKLQGATNNIYRQIQAGTNGTVMIKNYRIELFPGYNILKNIPFVSTVMLRTPIITHSMYQKKPDSFNLSDNNFIKNLKINPYDWFCYPIKTGDLLCYVYFHQDYLASSLSLANVFELADEEYCLCHNPDLICIYGNQFSDELEYFYDNTNNIWLSSVPYGEKCDFFAYLYSAIKTIFAKAKLADNKLPFTGSLIRICLGGNKYHNILFMDDYQGGSKARINADRFLLSYMDMQKANIIFDGECYFNTIGNDVFVNGVQTGMFVNNGEVTDSFCDVERSIFVNPDSSESYLIQPVCSYDSILVNHRIDYLVLLKDNKFSGIEKIDKNQDIFNDFIKLNEGDNNLNSVVEIIDKLIGNKTPIARLSKNDINSLEMIINELRENYNE